MAIKVTSETAKKLINIFNREKNRVGDKFTLFYREHENKPDEELQYAGFLQYKNDKGTLTVYFEDSTGDYSKSDPRGCENIYYRSNDPTSPLSKKDDPDAHTTNPFRTLRHKAVGRIIQEITKNGALASFNEELWDLPQEFQDIIHDYQFNRDAIGVEKFKEPTKSKSNYERDY